MASEIIKRQVNPLSQVRHGAEWILADCSESMLQPVAGTGLSRIEHLNRAAAARPKAQRLGFNSAVYHLAPGEEFVAFGGTYIVPALRFLAEWRPSWVFVISDGEIGDSVEEAYEIATEIAKLAIIETLYIGPDADTEAAQFMQELAEIGSGKHRRHDTTKPQQERLEYVIRKLLPGPTGKSIKL